MTRDEKKRKGIEVTYGRLCTLLGEEEAAVAKRDGWYESFICPVKKVEVFVYVENSTTHLDRRDKVARTIGRGHGRDRRHGRGRGTAGVRARPGPGRGRGPGTAGVGARPGSGHGRGRGTAGVGSRTGISIYGCNP